MSSLPELFNDAIGKMRTFVAANGYLHVPDSLLLVLANILLLQILTQRWSHRFRSPSLARWYNFARLAKARSTIQQYYNAINNHQYRVAYNTWQDNVTGVGQAYEQFATGYGNTVHDDISFDSVVPQDDTTVDVNITIHAHERNSTETFSASYVVGKVGDTWKIMGGSIQKIA